MNLTRPDIVGKHIKTLWCTPPSEHDGIFVTSVFVEIESGILFELVCTNPESEFPVVGTSRSELDFTELLVDHRADGDLILEVLSSDFWPSMGLLLSSNRFIYLSTDEDIRQVKPTIGKIGTKYDADDVVSYWGKQPIDHAL